MLKKILKKMYGDDKGSAMVMVIIAIAFISILIATLFWVTMANFFMKYTDAKNKENFYSAETIFEEMKAGMQKRASDELIKVYTTSFGDYTNGTTEAEIQDRYLTALYDFYKEDANHFNPTILIGYVEDMFHPYYDGAVGGAGTVPGGPGEFRYEAAIVSPKEIQKTDTELILKNITVRFSDHGTGYYSEITSDLAIGLPNISFSKSSELPAIFDYSIIADKGIKINNGMKLVTKKNIYGGDEGIAVGEGYAATPAGAELNLADTEYAVTRGTISLNGMADSDANRSSIVTGDNTKLYAHDIDISNGKGELAGKIYVEDDLIYSAAGKVKITGNYFGFGNSVTNPSKSSAVLVNSKNAELDLNDAGSVLLAGHAFVGTGNTQLSENKVTTTSANEAGILMDQSISVKGDQVAYLIPGSCIGVWKYDTGVSGEVFVGMNPVPDVTVSFNEAGKVIPWFYTNRFIPADFDTTDGHIETVDFDTPVHALKGNKLRDYSSEYKIVYTTQYGQNLAYFYLVMDETMAKKYMEDYYGVKKDSVDTYFKYYAKDSFIDNTAGDKEINTAGHYLTGPDKDNLNLSDVTSSSSLQSRNSMDIDSVYKALCAKLVTDDASVKADEYARTVYDNLIIDDEMPSTEKEYAIGDGTDRVRAIITPVDYEYKASVDPSKEIHLIVSQGDVTVEEDFSGVIITKGRVIVKDSAGAGKTVTLTGNREAVTRLLQNVYLADGTADKKVIDYFKDGAQYVLEGTAVSNNGAKADEQGIDFGQLVRYENWAKK